MVRKMRVKAASRASMYRQRSLCAEIDVGFQARTGYSVDYELTRRDPAVPLQITDSGAAP